MLNLVTLIANNNLIAQTTTSDLISDELGLLKFLVIFSYTAITSIAGFLGLTTWRNIQDAKQQVNSLVEEAVIKEIAEILDTKKEDVKAIIETESIIKQTNVKYCLPHSNKDIKSIEEFKLLNNRKYQITSEKNYAAKTPFLECDVFILDFVNGDFKDNDKDKNEILRIIETAAKNMLDKSTLVYFVKLRLDNGKLYSIFEAENINIYHTAANNALTLMGRVMDAAQITKASKGLEG